VHGRTHTQRSCSMSQATRWGQRGLRRDPSPATVWQEALTLFRFCFSARLIPVGAFAVRASLWLNIRVAGQPFIVASLAPPEPNSLFYFSHAAYAIRKNMLGQVAYLLDIVCY